MPGSWSVRLQGALLIALFLGSSTPLLRQVFETLTLPQRELDNRTRLREAVGRMTETAAAVAGPLAEQPGGAGEDINRRLHEISRQELAAFPGVEGGFYLGAGADRFVGYAYPTAPPGHGTDWLRTDPPPLEAPSIRLQAQQSLLLEPGESLFQARDVGPSRVLAVTEPVGQARPAPLAAWAMFRLTGPEDLQGEVRRFRWSVGVALAGLVVSLLLTVNLGRTLKRQWHERELLRDELRRSEHLAALGKLLAGVAHEVRNPLAGIRSTVQLWQRLPETARSPASLAAVVQTVDRLDEIVSRLLYFARMDNAARLPVAVNQVLGETLDLLEAQAAGQTVVIERDLADNLPVVPGAASALRQVFLNLTANALQAMPSGGKLRCSTRARAKPRLVEVRFADTGAGVTLETRQHLFEPFFTTRPDGTGLGLALCREIVIQHGGRIELEAGEGPGATFLVTLPVGDGNPASGGRQPPVPAKQQGADAPRSPI